MHKGNRRKFAFQFSTSSETRVHSLLQKLPFQEKRGNVVPVHIVKALKGEQKFRPIHSSLYSKSGK
jgi:hypothetical protein